MCGKDVKDIDRKHREMFEDPWGSFSKVTQDMKVDVIGDPLNLFGGLREEFGYYDERNRRAERATDERERLRRLALTPAPPPTATVLDVDVATDVRNKRRRAALSGGSPLSTQGPGLASGGAGYGRLNTTLG